MSEEEKTPVTSYQSNNDFMPRPIRSIMPKGRSALPRGGGLSNEPVSYSNPVTNFIKGRGSLSGKGLLATGMGLAKGHSVLVPGGGLVGTSLFKMKHYDPYGHDKDLVTEVVEGKKSGIKKPAGDKHKDIDPEEKKHDDETTVVKLKKPDDGANTKTILEKTLENYEYRLKLYDTYDQSPGINDRRIATLKRMEITKAELRRSD